MRTAITTLLLAGFTVSASLAATVDLSRYQRVVDLPPGPDREELVSVRLSADIFEATQSSLADIRIADPKNQSVPYLITQRTELVTERSRESLTLNRISFNDNAEQNRIEVVFERDSKVPPPGQLNIRTPIRNFEKSITVQVSPDSKTWEPIATSAVIFDASRYMDVSRFEVSFPEAPFRYYKVIIQDVTDSQTSPVSELSRFMGGSETGQVQYTDRTSTIRNRDFRIDQLEFSRTVVHGSVAKSRLIPVGVTNLVTREDEKAKKTIVRFEARRTPVTSIRLLTGSRNFSRRYILYTLDQEAGGQTPPRQELSRGTLTSFAFRTLVQDSTEITVRENRGPVYELAIENGDNPALDITGLALKGPEYQILYFSMPDSPRRLYFGDSEATRPDFDVSIIQTALDRGLMAVFIPDLGPARDNTDRSTSGTTGFRFNKKAALIGAMVVMVLVLGAALFKAARRSETGGGDGSI
jgi:hypothetical protein